MLQNNIRQKVEEKLLDSYGAMYRMAYSYVRNEQDALDIVQESAYKAMKYANSIKKEAYIETWLYRIVIHCAIDQLNHKKRELTSDEIEENNQLTSTDHYTDFDTIRALDVLKEKERAVVVLRFFEEKKLEEIAQILDMRLSTVKSLLYRSLKKLKIELQKGDISYEEIG